MSDDPLETTWQQVLDCFDDEATHKKFLTLCASLDRLADAGTRYREIKADPDDARSEMAGKQVDRLLVLAMEKLAVLKSEPGQKSSTKTILFLAAFAVSAALIGSALWSMLRSM